MGFVRRGCAFRFWLWERIVKVAGDRGWSVNRVVNEAVMKYLEGLSGVEVERFRLLAEEQRLLGENQRLFVLLKRVLRDGAYINDAAKVVLLGDENYYERWQKRADGVWDRLTKEEADMILRVFAAREKNTRRIVEIERQLLPKDRLKIDLVEMGWRMPGKLRRKKED